MEDVAELYQLHAEAVLRFHYRRTGCPQVVDEAGEGVCLQIGADGGSCDVTGGCPVRNRCLAGPDGVELENTTVRCQDEQVVMTTTRYQLEGATLMELDRVEERFDSASPLPEDAPTPEDSITIDC